MEDSTCTTDTIAIFRALHVEFPDTGIVLQAYMRRSEDDVIGLLGDRPNFVSAKGSTGRKRRSRSRRVRRYSRISPGSSI